MLSAKQAAVNAFTWTHPPLPEPKGAIKQSLKALADQHLLAHHASAVNSEVAGFTAAREAFVQSCEAALVVVNQGITRLGAHKDKAATLHGEAHSLTLALMKAATVYESQINKHDHMDVQALHARWLAEQRDIMAGFQKLDADWKAFQQQT